jgi:hypothetical protein
VRGSHIGADGIERGFQNLLRRVEGENIRLDEFFQQGCSDQTASQTAGGRPSWAVSTILKTPMGLATRERPSVRQMVRLGLALQEPVRPAYSSPSPPGIQLTFSCRFSSVTRVRRSRLADLACELFEEVGASKIDRLRGVKGAPPDPAYPSSCKIPFGGREGPPQVSHRRPKRNCRTIEATSI